MVQTGDTTACGMREPYFRSLNLALTGLAAHIDAAKLLFDKLPQEAKDAVKKTASEKLDAFKALVDKTVELPGVVKPL